MIQKTNKKPYPLYILCIDTRIFNKKNTRVISGSLSHEGLHLSSDEVEQFHRKPEILNLTAKKIKWFLKPVEQLYKENYEFLYLIKSFE